MRVGIALILEAKSVNIFIYDLLINLSAQVVEKMSKSRVSYLFPP